MSYMKQQYHDIHIFYKQNIRKIFMLMILLFVLSILVFSIILSTNPGLATRMLFKTSTLVDKTINLSGLFPNIFENIITGFLLLLAGVIPFLFISALIAISNGCIIGILLGSTTISNITTGSILASVLPHGIVLIPTMLLASSYGIFLCMEVSKHVLHKENLISFKELFIELLRSYLYVIVPLMLIASLLQTIITPLIISLM